MLSKIKTFIISYIRFKKIYGKTKIRFSKPKKKEILIYDNESKLLVGYIFDLSNCEVLHVRYEEINLYIVLKTIINNGISNFRLNYKINFIKCVAPKVVITDFTWNLSFFKLKNHFSKTKYVCIQRSLADNDFFKDCEKYLIKNPNTKLKADLIFVTGNYFNKKFSKLFEAKVYSIGSLKNNFYFLKDKPKKKINKILFISEANITADNFNSKIQYNSKIVKELVKYCKEKNLKLEIMIKHGIETIKIFEKYFDSELVKILPRKNDENSYNLINEASLIIFTNTTMGFEALAKGKKCVTFPLNIFPFTLMAEQGSFWSKKFSYEILSNYLDKIINLSNYEWNIQVHDKVSEFFKYNPMNEKLLYEFKKLNVTTTIEKQTLC